MESIGWLCVHETLRSPSCPVPLLLLCETPAALLLPEEVCCAVLLLGSSVYVRGWKCACVCVCERCIPPASSLEDPGKRLNRAGVVFLPGASKGRGALMVLEEGNLLLICRKGGFVQARPASQRDPGGRQHLPWSLSPEAAGTPGWSRVGLVLVVLLLRHSSEPPIHPPGSCSAQMEQLTSPIWGRFSASSCLFILLCAKRLPPSCEDRSRSRLSPAGGRAPAAACGWLAPMLAVRAVVWPPACPCPWPTASVLPWGPRALRR